MLSHNNTESMPGAGSKPGAGLKYAKAPATHCCNDHCLHHGRRTDGDARNVIITLDNVGLRREGKIILEDVSLSIAQGDFLAITGPNGGGKTTLLRLILRLLKPTTGRVSYFNHGTPVDRLPIGYLPQKNMIDSRFPITVKEVITSGLIAIKGLDKAERAERVERAIATVGLDSRRDFTLDRLSGGQLQRTLLARAIISCPQILVLDEPLSYLDKQFEHRVYDIISELAPSTTIILVSHEMSRIASMANRHIIVDHRLEECTADHHYFAIDCPHDR